MLMVNDFPDSQQGDILHYDGKTCRRMLSPEEAFDKTFEQQSLHVHPGETRWLEGDSEMLVAVVGAGVVLTIFEEQQKFGVLSHFVLSPQLLGAFPNVNDIDVHHLEEVCSPIEKAICEMKKNGAGRNRIRIRLFGGANMKDDQKDSGLKNYVFLKEYLERKKLRVMSEDIGGTVLRRVHFLPHSGAVYRFMMRRKSDFSNIFEQEHDYFDKLSN